MVNQQLKSFAKRLSDALPQGIHLVAMPPATIVYHGPDETPAYIDVQAMLDRGDVLAAALCILGGVQDHVVRDVRSQWPAWNNELAMPQAVSGTGGIQMWYGTDTMKVVDLGTWAY